MEVSSLAGRKAVSSSAVDKLKKKRRKKRKLKEGKRSSASSASATGSPDSVERPHKSRSSFSCPPNITPSKPKKADEEMEEISQSFNDSLRWLPYIVTYSNILPPKSTSSRLCSPIASKIVASSSSTVSETVEEEEDRIAIYKMNRRKRYLAAQQALLSLYPDSNIYAGSSILEDRLPEQGNLHTDEQRSPHLPSNMFSSGLLSDPSSESIHRKFELAIKPSGKDSTPIATQPVAT